MDKYIPKGTLSLFNSPKGLNHVNVSGIGKRRLYKDSEGSLFVKIAGNVWKFPEQVEY